MSIADALNILSTGNAPAYSLHIDGIDITGKIEVAFMPEGIWRPAIVFYIQ